MSTNQRPPLMCVLNRPLSPESLKTLRHTFSQANCDLTRVSIIEPGVKLYQLLDGKWSPLDPADGPPAADRQFIIADGT